MFNYSKYTTTYYNIINRAKLRTLADNTYYEKHHIIPKSLGGNNKKINLVHLTIKEHRLCHLLLTKMVTNPRHKISMFNAAWRMNVRHTTLGLSKGSYYQIIKDKFVECQKNKTVTNETRQKIQAARAKQTNISNQYLSGNYTISPRKGNTKENDSGYHTVSKKLKGRTITWQDKLSIAAHRRPKCSCIKCKKVVTVGYNGDQHFIICLG